LGIQCNSWLIPKARRCLPAGERLAQNYPCGDVLTVRFDEP
jgi:hypothetical protein